MTRAQKRRFTKILETKRDELIREIAEIRERLSIDPENDPMDQVRSVSDRDFAIRSVAQMYALLRLVDAALGEIHARTFGICARCGDDIPIKRLQAVPWSPYCVSCQEIAERLESNGRFPEADAPYAIAS
jgi:DnaK suppressor protein